MLRRITIGAGRGGIWFVLLLTVLLALYLLIGRIVVFTIASSQTSLEVLLRNTGLEQLNISHAVGDWRGFDPVFRLDGVQVGQGEGDPVRIKELRLRVDFFKSLLERGPVFSEMELAGVRLTLVADDDGIRIKGFGGTGQMADLNWLFDTVPHLEVVSLSDVDVAVEGRNNRVLIRSRDGEPWQILGNGERKSVLFPVYIVREGDGNSWKNRLHFTGSYSGDFRSDDFLAKLYLNVPTLDLVNFLPDISIANQKLNTADFSSEIWLDVKPDEVSVIGNIELGSILSQQAAGPQALVDHGSLQFRYTGSSFTEGSIVIPSLEFVQGEFRYALTDILGAMELDDGFSFVAEIPAVDVAQVADLLQFAGDKQLLPGRLSTALSVVKPRGLLQDVTLLFHPSRSEPLLVGNLVNFRMDAYLGVPAIDPLNGLLVAQPSRGYLDIDNDAFVMDFAQMFKEPWPFDSGRGRISYEYVDDTFRVESGLVELTRGDLEAYGQVVLNLPPTRDLQTWGLTLGINDADLLDSHKFIPNVLPDTLVDWLDSAIQGGASEETGLTFHGALFRGAPRVRKLHDLFFKVEDATLNYHPDWPDIRNSSGTLHINNRFVRSDDLQGRVYDTPVSTAKVEVPLDVDGRADSVYVDAGAIGPVSDLIRVLNETPLAESTANVAEVWQGLGSLQFDMALEVPVGDRAGEEVLVEVAAVFDEVDLQMPEFDLQFADLKGMARYSSAQGLHSSGFTGRSFDRPIAGSIATVIDNPGSEISVTVDGAIAATALFEWSDQLLLSRSTGELSYNAVVHIPFGDETKEPYVEASSDLTGVSLNLPYPLDKLNAEDSRRFRYRQHFSNDSYRVHVMVDDDLKASLQIEDGIAVGGLVHFGQEPLASVDYDRIRMTGHLDYLDVQRWLQVIDELSEVSDVALNDEIAAHLEFAELSIEKLLFYDLELPSTGVRVVRNQGAWVTSLDNAMLKGQVIVADADDVPVEIMLEQLQLDNSDDASDSLGDVNPSEIDNINFSTDSLMINGEDYGSWAFNFRVDDQVARFEDIDATPAGLRVLPSSIVEWRVTEGIHSTSYIGDIEVDDLALVMSKFGFASSVEGQELKIDANVSWSGSPAMIDVERIVGQVGIHEGKGRFVQAETGGALKLLGIFDFTSIARRLRLDFSDVVEKGFEFSEISGVTAFDKGQVGMVEPIVIEGSTAKFTLGGELDLKAETLNNEMIVTLPVTRTLPWYAAYSAIAAGPLSGVGVMIAQRVFEDQIDQMSSAKYRISGTLDSPDIEFVAIFDDKVAGKSEEAVEAQP